MTNNEVATKKITVSHSEVDSYLRCERQHFYGYGLGVTRINESDSLARGTAGHKILEKFFNGLKDGLDVKDLNTQVFADCAEIAILNPDQAGELIRTFIAFFNNYPFYGWVVEGVEQEYVLPVTEGLAIPFVVDLLIRDPYGYLWVIDHKFMYDYLNDRDLELTPQLAKYFIGLKALGVQVDRAAYSVYRYRPNQKDDNYKFTPVDFTQERLVQTIREQAIVADRILKLKELPIEQWSYNAMRVSNKMVCNSCSFRSLCVAELNDWQPNLVLSADYKPRQRREFTVEKMLED